MTEDKLPTDNHPRFCSNDVYMNSLGHVRIMACVQGYVMARRPGAMPFVLFWRDFLSKYEYVGKGLTEQRR
jgi:hypothetical protein